MSDYKLVPVEPTEAMIDAARDQHEGDPYLPVSLYKAMLAAAPDVQGEPVAEEVALFECASCNHLHQGQVTRCDCMPDEQKFNRWRARPERTAPQPEQDAPKSVLKAIAEILRKAQGVTDAETGIPIDVGAECVAIRGEFEKRDSPRITCQIYGHEVMGCSECTPPATVAEEITEDDARNILGYTPPEDNNAAYYYSEGWNACLDEIAAAPTPEQQDHSGDAELVAALEELMLRAHPAYVGDDLMREKLITARELGHAALSAHREQQS